jgi:hypothetical protein
MVGTDRQTAGLPVWPGEVGTLIARAAGDAPDAATGVLRAAAVLATCGLAGAQGVAWPEPLPSPAVPDALPTLENAALLATVSWTLHEGPARLHQALCIALASARRRLPTALLPQALELGRRSLALRALLLPVLGECGLWLAAQREDWRYAAGVSAESANDDAAWNDGSVEQRRAFLARERTRDPQAARERLARSLAELPARERADLVGVLAEQLSLDDEAFLDSLRADRSREVRQAALDLLLRLPQAAHPLRAVARIEPLLKHERVLLRKRWLIDAPAAAGADWKADNLDAARPKNESLGERAWWLYQLVRQVPLGWWTEHTGMSAAELREWAGGTDWAEALLRGWRDVILASHDTDWCEAWLDHWPKAALRDERSAFLALLPLAARERHWERQLRDGSLPLQALVPQILAACPAGDTLSPRLSATLAELVHQRAESRRLADDYSLRAELPELCCALHVDALARLAALPRHADETPSFADTLQAVMNVIAARRALHTLTTSSTT